MDKTEAISVVRNSGLAHHADRLIQSLLPSARLVICDKAANDAEGCANSHLGGLPRLPLGTVWPLWDKRELFWRQVSRFEDKLKGGPAATGLHEIVRRMGAEVPDGPTPLTFLGQFSLSELFARAPLPGWPRSGYLAFFTDPKAWTFDPLARGHCRILFIPESEPLERLPAPHDLPECARFPERRVSFEREWTLPTRLETGGERLSSLASGEYRELCNRLLALGGEDRLHRCGGHPQEIQGDMRLECQLVTNGIYCGDLSMRNDPRVPTLAAGAPDWRLLLQIDSDKNRLGWMWGDAGRIYFWARQQDVEAADFDGAWSILQCY
jgi:uncharacterized protein YwqG